MNNYSSLLLIKIMQSIVVYHGFILSDFLRILLFDF